MDLEPILAVWDGLYLDGDTLTEAELQPYVDDVLNELEFLTVIYLIILHESFAYLSQGPSTSVWGAKRASLGYPNPFTINYLEIGNEDFLNNGIPTYLGILP